MTDMDILPFGMKGGRGRPPHDIRAIRGEIGPEKGVLAPFGSQLAGVRQGGKTLEVAAVAVPLVAFAFAGGRVVGVPEVNVVGLLFGPQLLHRVGGAVVGGDLRHRVVDRLLASTIRTI
jgi:hypothetical protein